jgi:hypothetical protein
MAAPGIGGAAAKAGRDSLLKAVAAKMFDQGAAPRAAGTVNHHPLSIPETS